MNVVAVRTTLALGGGGGEDAASAAASADKEVLAPSAVFAHLHAAAKKAEGGSGGGEELYLADSGSVSPNPATDHLLRRQVIFTEVQSKSKRFIFKCCRADFMTLRIMIPRDHCQSMKIMDGYATVFPSFKSKR